jgi:hypothetical protein
MTGAKGLVNTPSAGLPKQRFLHGSLFRGIEWQLALVPPAILTQIHESGRKDREKLALANAARNKRLAERKAAREPEQLREKAKRAARKLGQQREKQVGV